LQAVVQLQGNGSMELRAKRQEKVLMISATGSGNLNLVPYSPISCSYYKKLGCKALIPFIGVSNRWYLSAIFYLYRMVLGFF
jgi:hypothetical protein